MILKLRCDRFFYYDLKNWINQQSVRVMLVVVLESIMVLTEIHYGFLNGDAFHIWRKQKSTGNRSRILGLLGRVGLKSHKTPVGQLLMAYFPGQTLNNIWA